MSDTIISARELRKTYHVGDVDVHALRGVNLDVRRGEFLSIVGHSGSGKSTLFNVIGGLTPPTAGQIMIDGKDLRADVRNRSYRIFGSNRSGSYFRNTIFCRR